MRTAATTAPAGSLAPKEGHMFTVTTAQAEVEVREFCATFPGANVRRMLALCESGRIAWLDAYGVATKALADAQAAA